MTLRHDYEGTPVLGISRHRLGVDGKGVTTLVAFHGCNLRCKYCLNPDALGPDEGLPQYTPESLYEKVKVDDLYFRATGGGITFGGGEPCLQADFIVRFRELCGDDWKIRLETSLCAPLDNISKLIPVVDEWIVDIKTDDPDVYERYTGHPFAPVYQNLRGLLVELGYNSDKLRMRIPVIPGFTTPEMVEETKRNFEAHGVAGFDLFTYYTERPQTTKSMIEGLPPGKAKCELLRALRKDLAQRYGVRYREQECDHEGDCSGTCPLCEAELESLTQQFKVIAPAWLEVSDKVMELCQLNGSASCDSLPADADSSRAEIYGLEGIYGPHDDEDIPDGGGETLPPEMPEMPAQPEPPRFEYRRVFFKECAVAGLSFHLEKDDELWDELCEGAKLALVRDRKNKYDKNAVAVALADDYDGNPDDFDFDFILGYIPRKENAELAALMDAGYADKFEAEITTYHRYGSYNDRIRITIWLLSSEPEEVRPDRLRLQSLGFSECKAMIDELQQRGTVHFRWGFFSDDSLSMPIVGEEVVLIRRQAQKVLMYRMKVIAEGEDCIPFLDDPEEIHCVDDRATFVLTNIAGPVIVDLNELYFLDKDSIGKREVYDRLSVTEDRALRELFDEFCNSWLEDSNTDMNP